MGQDGEPPHGDVRVLHPPVPGREGRAGRLRLHLGHGRRARLQPAGQHRAREAGPGRAVRLGVLQLGPSTGPFDFQFCTDELFTGTGRGRYGAVWKNYIDDFWVRTGQWLNGRAYTDQEYQVLLAAASP